MKKTVKRILFTGAMACCCTLNAQQPSLAAEAGAVINEPLVQTQRFQSPQESTLSADWTLRHFTSVGYFLKFSYEGGRKSQKKTAALRFPAGISLMQQTYSYHQKGYSFGCFGGTSADEFVTTTNRIINYSMGPLLTFNAGTRRFFISALLNACFTFQTGITTSAGNSSEIKRNKTFLFYPSLYLSNGFGMLQEITPRLRMGPSVEVFWMNTLRLRNTIRSWDYDFSSGFDLTGRNIWINPALKIQYSLE